MNSKQRILSTFDHIELGHSINPAMPFNNYKTMIDVTKKYGKYPLKIAD